MVGVPFLVSKWAGGTVLADRLALALPDAKARDHARTEQENEEQRGDNGAGSAESDIAEDVERRQALAQLAEEIEH